MLLIEAKRCLLQLVRLLIWPQAKIYPATVRLFTKDPSQSNSKWKQFFPPRKVAGWKNYASKIHCLPVALEKDHSPMIRRSPFHSQQGVFWTCPAREDMLDILRFSKRVEVTKNGYRLQAVSWSKAASLHHWSTWFYLGILGCLLNDPRLIWDQWSCHSSLKLNRKLQIPGASSAKCIKMY